MAYLFWSARIFKVLCPIHNRNQDIWSSKSDPDITRPFEYAENFERTGQTQFFKFDSANGLFRLGCVPIPEVVHA